MKRLAWLDYMKFIAMFFVVIYHTPPRYDTAHEVALFNMGAPVFFFAAGYLFNIARQKDFFTFLRHRARQILVPYTTFFIIFYALWLVVGRRMAGPEEMAIGTLTPVWQFIQGTPDVVLGPFWFLAALFTMQVIYYPIRKYLSGYWPLVAALLLSLSLFILPDVPCFRYWNLDRALLYMPLYALGNCCHPLVEKLEQLNVGSGIARNVAITGITYLALQNYLIGVIKMLVAKFAGPNILDDNILMKVSIAIVVMIILYPMALFIDRYLPWLLGKSRKA